MTLINRVRKYADFKRITIKDIERKCGLSNGYFRIIQRPGVRKLDRILTEYPDLNRDWLLYEEGEMLNSGFEENILSPASGEKEQHTEALPPDLTAILKAHAEERARLEEIIRMCNEENKRLIDTIDALNLTLRGLMNTQNR